MKYIDRINYSTVLLLFKRSQNDMIVNTSRYGGKRSFIKSPWEVCNVITSLVRDLEMWFF
jgi:hypothetical protein